MATNVPITIFKDTTSALDLVPVEDGNILFDTDKKTILVDDNEGNREPYGANQNASGIYATDTYGVLGLAGETVTTQAMLDYTSKQGAANEIDPTLTKEGQAADAKATGDADKALEEKYNELLEKANLLEERLTQLYSNLAGIIYKGVISNADDAEINGIYEMNPSTNMGTSGLTANFGVIICFGHPSEYDQKWQWQIAYYTNSFTGGRRTKTNNEPWTEWTPFSG